MIVGDNVFSGAESFAVSPILPAAFDMAAVSCFAVIFDKECGGSSSHSPDVLSLSSMSSGQSIVAELVFACALKVHVTVESSRQKI